MPSGELNWRIEQTCFNAFPSLKQVILGDWLMRFSDGLSRRANSVNPMRAECVDAASVITAAEPLYAAHRLPTVFRVPSIADGVLDRELAAHSYPSEGESCVLYGVIEAVPAATDRDVQLLPRPEPRWLAALAALQGHSPAQADTYRRIVAAIATPSRFALLAVDGAPTALAYGALHDGLLCYESVITDPRRRRQGLSRRIIASLASWAHANGATGVCLQVEARNAPARALYAGLDLIELYRYHYRRAPSRT